MTHSEPTSVIATEMKEERYSQTTRRNNRRAGTTCLSSAWRPERNTPNYKPGRYSGSPAIGKGITESVAR